MSKPFFLTRQTANLMEDFTRELKAGASLFLLYGETGVGKTRLLRELQAKRLNHARVHWIDLSGGDPEDSTASDSSSKIEALFESAQDSDIIIADHFEQALKKTRHQLFLSWSTDGADKRLSLIISSSTEGFNELRQLSQQYQVRVQSFQLMPFNGDELEAFLGFYLFPEHPIGKLAIPSDLRKQIVATQGAVGPIIELADHDGARILSTPMTDTESIRQGSRVIVTMLILCALTFGGVWYYLSSQGEVPDLAAAVVGEPEPVAAADAAQAAVVDSAAAQPTAAQAEPAPASLPAPEPELQPVIDSEMETTTQAESAITNAPADVVVDEIEVVAEAEIEMSNASSTQAVFEPESEPGTASDSEAVIVESAQAAVGEIASAETIVTVAEPVTTSYQDRFQRELERSTDWINSNDKSVGTVQILVLSFDSFDPAAYFEHVDYLSNQQVDVAQLRILKTYTDKKQVYSVVFGEYESWRAASNAIDKLPEVLRKTSPIPRSVGGLREEIRRLEVLN